MKKIIILSIFLVGCARPVTEWKAVCDNGFESDWWTHTSIAYESAMIKWSSKGKRMYYHIPQGVTCTKYKRTVMK